jgi:hypothetical protein
MRSRHAHHVRGFHEDVLHVVHIGADVFRRDVAAVQRFDEGSKRSEEAFRLIRLGIGDDDRFAAAQIEPRDRGLVGHAF